MKFFMMLPALLLSLNSMAIDQNLECFSDKAMKSKWFLLTKESKKKWNISYIDYNQYNLHSGDTISQVSSHQFYNANKNLLLELEPQKEGVFTGTFKYPLEDEVDVLLEDSVYCKVRK